MLQGKIQTKNIVVGSGSAAAVSTYRVTLDNEYEECIGIAVVENTAGGLTRYNVGLKDDSKTYIEPSNVNMLKTTSNYKADERFMRGVPFKAAGKTVTIMLETFAATTSELNFDFLFLLRRNDNCLPVS